MAGEPRKRSPNLYCHYHQDHGHTTENCRNLWDHLEQLVREGKLKQRLHHSSSRASQAGSELCGDASSRLPLGTINVIFAAPGRTGSCPSRVLSMFRTPAKEHSQVSKRARMDVPLILGFSDDNMVRTIQISNLWFSFFPFRNHKHKHKLTWLRWTEPKKKKEEKRKKMENKVEWGRVTLMAMGEEDERGRGLCDSARLATARMKWSWESR